MIDSLIFEIQYTFEKALEDLSSLNKIINYTYEVKEKVEQLERLQQRGSYQKHLCAYIYESINKLDWDSNMMIILFGIRNLIPKLKNNYKYTEEDWKQVREYMMETSYV
jgi:hypothetical protein